MNGKHLKILLEHRGIKQKWVAKQIGVSPQVVNQWIKGSSNIPPSREKELKFLLKL